jgi:hypothetical protein
VGQSIDIKTDAVMVLLNENADSIFILFYDLKDALFYAVYHDTSRATVKTSTSPSSHSNKKRHLPIQEVPHTFVIPRKCCPSGRSESQCQTYCHPSFRDDWY